MRFSRVFFSVFICSSRFFSSCCFSEGYLHLLVFGESSLQLARDLQPRDAHALQDEVFDLELFLLHAELYLFDRVVHLDLFFEVRYLHLAVLGDALVQLVDDLAFDEHCVFEVCDVYLGLELDHALEEPHLEVDVVLLDVREVDVASHLVLRVFLFDQQRRVQVDRPVEDLCQPFVLDQFFPALAFCFDCVDEALEGRLLVFVVSAFDALFFFDVESVGLDVVDRLALEVEGFELVEEVQVVESSVEVAVPLEELLEGVVHEFLDALAFVFEDLAVVLVVSRFVLLHEGGFFLELGCTVLHGVFERSSVLFVLADFVSEEFESLFVFDDCFSVVVFGLDGLHELDDVVFVFEDAVLVLESLVEEDEELVVEARADLDDAFLELFEVLF